MHNCHRGQTISLIAAVPLGGYIMCTPVMCPVLVTAVRNKGGMQIMCICVKGVANQ